MAKNKRKQERVLSTISLYAPIFSNAAPPDIVTDIFEIVEKGDIDEELLNSVCLRFFGMVSESEADSFPFNMYEQTPISTSVIKQIDTSAWQNNKRNEGLVAKISDLVNQGIEEIATGYLKAIIEIKKQIDSGLLDGSLDYIYVSYFVVIADEGLPDMRIDSVEIRSSIFACQGQMVVFEED